MVLMIWKGLNRPNSSSSMRIYCSETIPLSLDIRANLPVALTWLMSGLVEMNTVRTIGLRIACAKGYIIHSVGLTV